MTLLKWRIKILKKWAQQDRLKASELEPVKKEEELDSEAENMAWEKVRGKRREWCVAVKGSIDSLTSRFVPVDQFGFET